MEISKIRMSEWLYPLDHLGKNGTVYSVSANMLNIKIGNRLVNITNFSEYLASFGISLPKESFKQAISFVQPGNLVKIKADQLVIYSRERVETLLLQKIETVSLKLSDFELTPAQVARLKDILVTKDLQTVIGLTNEPRAETVFEQLRCQSILSVEQWQEILSYLIGRGPGSTPSGDDLLIAYYAMLVVQKDVRAIHLKQALRTFDLTKTTLLSQNYLQAVIEGQVNSFIYQVFADLANEVSDETLSRDIERLLYIGHSSGKDMTYGLYLGLG